MKAILFDRHGGPDVLRYTEVPQPELRFGEVLVGVHACALNHLDLWVRGGLPGVPIPLPHIPGSDIAGVVEGIAAGVTTVKPGQKVLLAPGVTCGKCTACLAGHDNYFPRFTNLRYLIDAGGGGVCRFRAAHMFSSPSNPS